MSLATELVDAIRAQIAKSTKARSMLAAVREQLANSIMLLQQATDGSNDPRPYEAMMGYQVGMERLEEAEKQFLAAEEALEAYITHILGVGDGEAKTPVRAEVTERLHVSDKTSRMKRNPEREAVVRRIGWPSKPGRPNDIRARGLLYGGGEKPISGSEDQPLWADRNGSASKRTDLNPGWATGSEKTSTWHIEGNSAAWMVQHQRREAVLYINQSVCGMRENEPPDPSSCAENLKHVLPKGYTLYVHSVLRNGSVRITRHRGTGKAIKSE